MQSKQKIEISSKLAELLIALTKRSLDSSEQNAMFSNVFGNMCYLLDNYDSSTIEEIHGNLFYIESILDLLNEENN